ncbi:hypothetical protein V9T40_014090 [Parthenolecanium corni]|uniref:Uncharacterized protein n=1 Tax=Parthenolecanium corni TaxID=536013 RepID=A0AAN9TCA6_9HEMI
MLISIRDLIEKVLRKRKDEDASSTTPTPVEYESMAEVLRQGKAEFERKWQLKMSSSIRLSDMEICKTLGFGKFGRVILVRLLSRQNAYAATKVMNKRVILAHSTVECVIFEKKILQATSFPFLVRYYDHFKDNANLYLVLEYVPGGDMFTHLRRANRFDDASTRFYVAQITLSLEYLHHLGIVHRDLKPENLMVGVDGFLKIADFGLAKRIGVRGKTSTKCGTKVYMAPELLAMRRVYYSFDVDWWALGVMTYEMTVGRMPFEASHPMEMLYKINRRQIRYPAYMNENTVRLVHGLLEPNLKYRLVSTQQVKAHPYFQKTNWMQLYYKKVRPPFVPVVRSARDTNNFDPISDEPIEEWSEDVFAKEFEDF